MLNQFPVAVRLALIAGFSILALIGVSIFGLVQMRAELETDRRHEVEQLAEVMAGVLNGIAAEQAAGRLDAAATTAQSIAVVNQVRYGDNDYFYLLNQQGVVVAHGGDAKLIGRNLSAVKDANGKAFIVDQLAAARAGGGYVDYVWPRAGATDAVPKLTYVTPVGGGAWILGTGIYIDDVDTLFWENVALQGGILLAVLLVVGLVTFAIATGVTRPLTEITKAMRRLAADDTGITIGYTEYRDELGDLARALATFKENRLEMDRLRTAQEAAKRAADQRRTAEMQALATGFEADVGGIIRQTAQAADELKLAAAAMRTTAEATTGQAEHIAQGAEESSANAQTVAAATEELSGSIGEIQRQVAQSGRIADQAEQEVAAANTKVRSLAEAVNKIGQIVELINAIASQTNLLALNATIEAARAGDAGKGFAVVASEVKNLANQTAKATEEIGAQIGAIQGATGESVTAMAKIDTIIREVKQYSSMIAAAVEQQGAATQEITRNVQRTADATSIVSRNVAGVRDGAAETGRAAHDILGASHGMADNAAALRSKVDGFLGRVRAG